MSMNRSGQQPRYGKPPRGMALVLVLAALAAAAMMSYALLASASLQTQVGHNAANGAAAESLAESGLELAAYYLYYPLRAPARNAQGYWSGKNDIAIPGTSGTLDVSVVRHVENDVYDIRSTARVPGNGGTLTHTATATVALRCFVLRDKQAATFADSITLSSGMSVQGDLYSDGTLKLDAGSSVSGTAWARAFASGSGAAGSRAVLSANTPLNVPSPASMGDYQTYSVGGLNGVAEPLPAVWDPAAQLYRLSNAVLGPNPPNNPGGVYYVDGPLRLDGAVQMTGTLVVRSVQTMVNGTLVTRPGRLIINGADNVISGSIGLPALIVRQDLVLNRSRQGLTVNGLTWLGGGIQSGGDNRDSHLTFNGAFVMGGSGQLDPNLAPGTISIRYDASYLGAADANGRVMQVPQEMKILSWNP